MITFQLPAGPKNLSPLFPAVDFNDVEEYYITLVNGATTYVTTPKYQRLSCCDDLIIWLYFVNYSGGIDSVPFFLKKKQSEVKSSKWKQPVKTPLQRFSGGWQRINVTQQTSYTLECYFFSEEEQPYLEQLIAAPNAWIFATGKQGLTDTYIPVTIEDGRFVTRKDEERYFYSLEIDITLSNDSNLLRN